MPASHALSAAAQSLPEVRTSLILIHPLPAIILLLCSCTPHQLSLTPLLCLSSIAFYAQFPCIAFPAFLLPTDRRCFLLRDPSLFPFSHPVKIPKNLSVLEKQITTFKWLIQCLLSCFDYLCTLLEK